MEYVQFGMSHFSSVNLHPTKSRRKKMLFCAHLKELHVGEQAFD
jgi:hypothetical protein